MIKVARHKGEDAKVAIRNVRRKAKEELDRIVKDGEAGEDDGPPGREGARRPDPPVRGQRRRAAQAQGSRAARGLMSYLDESEYDDRAADGRRCRTADVAGHVAGPARAGRRRDAATYGRPDDTRPPHPAATAADPTRPVGRATRRTPYRPAPIRRTSRGRTVTASTGTRPSRPTARTGTGRPSRPVPDRSSRTPYAAEPEPYRTEPAPSADASYPPDVVPGAPAPTARSDAAEPPGAGRRRRPATVRAAGTRPRRPDRRAEPAGRPSRAVGPPQRRRRPAGAGPAPAEPGSAAPKSRAGRNLPAAIGVGRRPRRAGRGRSLFFWRPAFLGVVAVAVGVGIWELVRAVRAQRRAPAAGAADRRRRADDRAGLVRRAGRADASGCWSPCWRAMVWRLADGAGRLPAGRRPRPP